jgi:GntR family transcriptional regulator
MSELSIRERLAALQPDPDSSAPLYLQLVERIAAAIAGGKLQDGEALPPERMLAEQLEVSRTTVRKALDELVTRGLVTSRWGSGTYVSRRVEQPLALLTSFSDDMRARRRRPGSVWLERGQGLPSPEEQVSLGLAPGEAVSRLVRLRLADGEPLCLERATIPARFLPEPEAVGDSLYMALRARGHEPFRALQHLRAAAASPVEAEQLGIRPGEPVMATVRYGYLADGRPVELTHATFRGDRYDFVAEMRRG